MNETLLFLLLAAICILVGAFLGNLFARLKMKNETSKLEERIQQASFQQEKLEERFTTTLQQREAIREEKDFLNAELIKRNTEFLSKLIVFFGKRASKLPCLIRLHGVSKETSLGVITSIWSHN